MGEYYAVYQSGAELLGVGMTVAERRAILRCSTRTKPNPYADGGVS